MRWVRLIAWLNLVANLLIIATGGAVRLTASGLGCSSWPTCTDESWVPTAEQGLHGVIEFSNRLMSPILGVLAALAIVAVAVWARRRKDLWWHAGILIGGIVVQAVIGGIVVLTQLSVSTVGVHYVVSAALVGVCASFVIRAGSQPGPRVRAVPKWIAIITHVATLLLALVVIGGVVTTQAGPHSGDEEVIRDSSAWDVLVHVHAWLGYALVAVLVLLVVCGIVVPARARRLDPAAEISGFRRFNVALALLLVTICVQIAVGIVQARLGIPAVLVGIHMVIAGIAVAFGVALVYALKRPVASAS